MDDEISFESLANEYGIGDDESDVVSIPAFFTSTPSGRPFHAAPHAAPPPPRPPVESQSLCAGRNAGIRLRPVSDLPDAYRQLFKFPVFNAVQSAVFDTAFHTDENAVVCAPTGSGKTCIFELALLRLLAKENLWTKAVYVAPTKALCDERVNDWKARFQHLGLNIVEITGDTGFNNINLAKTARVIVTTPEKWDSLTRRWKENQKILSSLRLFLIDEVHILHDRRGACLEVVVARMKMYGNNIRFLALSATAPNIEDVGEWIGNQQSLSGSIPAEATDGRAIVFKFGDEYRPCPLHKIVYGYPPPMKGGNEFSFATTLSYKLMSVIKEHSAGKAVLVFTPTRKEAINTAEFLTNQFKALMEKSQVLPWEKPKRMDVLFGDKKLQDLAQFGVAYHHAGLSVASRKAVELSFTNGNLSVLCATTSLAVGVNLPAHCVIIKGTKLFSDGWRDYSDMDILQMIGRAGRPQFDDHGVAVILTNRESKAKYEDLTSGRTILESNLHHELTEHINAEIGLKTITDLASALRWLRSSFLNVRIRKNPSHYRLSKDGDANASPEERLQKICLNAIKNLQQNALIDGAIDQGNGFDVRAAVGSTDMGDIMSKYYLRYGTMLKLMGLKEKASMREILEMLSMAEEYDDIRLRQGEKHLYNQLRIHQEVRYPPQKVNGVADKVSLLIQGTLAGLSLSEVLRPKEGASTLNNPMGDALVCFRHASRITKAIMDIAIARKDGAIVKNAFELVRSLSAKAWDNSPVVLRQIESIGEKSIKALAAAGINNLQDLAKADPLRVQMLLNRNAPYGQKIVEAAAAFPQFALSVQEISVEVGSADSPVEVVISVVVRVVTHKKMKTRPKEGRPLYQASVLTVSSDNEFIDFRRMPVKKLVDAKTFELHITLSRPSQRVNIICACDEIAGAAARCQYVPNVLSTSYPTPNTMPGPDLESETLTIVDELEDEDIDMLAESDLEERAVDLTVQNEYEQGLEQRESARRVSAEAQEAPIQLPNGNYRCRHLCKDRTSCRHICCREGLPKPPPTKKRSCTQPSTGPRAAASVAVEKLAVHVAREGMERNRPALQSSDHRPQAKPIRRRRSTTSDAEGQQFSRKVVRTGNATAVDVSKADTRADSGGVRHSPSAPRIAYMDLNKYAGTNFVAPRDDQFSLRLEKAAMGNLDEDEESLPSVEGVLNSRNQQANVNEQPAESAVRGERDDLRDNDDEFDDDLDDWLKAHTIEEDE